MFVLFGAALLLSFVSIRMLISADRHQRALDDIRGSMTVLTRNSHRILLGYFTPAEEDHFTDAVNNYNMAISEGKAVLEGYDSLEFLLAIDRFISPVLNNLAASLHRYRDRYPSSGNMPLMEHLYQMKYQGLAGTERLTRYLHLEQLIVELDFFTGESSVQFEEAIYELDNEIADIRESGLRYTVLVMAFLLIGTATAISLNSLAVIYRAQVAEGAAEERSHALGELVRPRTADLEIQNRQLREAGEMLAEREKMAALGQVVSGVAHEVNTPLGICVTATTYLADLVTDEERELDRQEAADVIRLILDNITRASNLVKGFKKVAVDEMDDDRRSFDLASYLQDDLMPGLRSMLSRSRHELEFSGPESTPVHSYPGSVAQIVTNLVMNASIHGYGTSSSGSLIRIMLEDLGSRVVLSVRDDGRGMAENVRKRLFEPFFTTNRENGGSGLGMMVVYNITTMKLGGTIECISAPEEGTTIRIDFPKDCREGTPRKTGTDQSE